MSKKTSVSRNRKKAAPLTTAAVAGTTTAAAELSFDEMLSELEAIVSEADTRLAEEVISL